MRFERTESFKGDYRGLSDKEKQLFGSAVRAFNVACDEYVANVGGFRWPASLRVKAVHGALGVWEMTWSFSGPDGRATFERVEVEVADSAGQAIKVPAVRGRRLGGHRIFTGP